MIRIKNPRAYQPKGWPRLYYWLVRFARKLDGKLATLAALFMISVCIMVSNGFGQISPPFQIRVFANAPTGTCANSNLWGFVPTTGNLYNCPASLMWTLFTGGASSGVTSFSAGNAAPLFTTTVANPTTTPALSFTITSQNANLVYAGPTSGGAATPTFRALVGADLPNPSASTLGGVESLAAVSHKWINTISTGGAPSATQPACGDLSDSAASCNTDATNASNISSGTLPTGRLPANQIIRTVGAGFDGGGTALTSGSTATVYFTVPFACSTFVGWNITVDTGTITFDVWKIATGSAIPTATNTITASALPALSSGTALHSTTMTGWTTTSAANDIWGININTVASATKASFTLQCSAS